MFLIVYTFPGLEKSNYVMLRKYKPFFEKRRASRRKWLRLADILLCTKVKIYTESDSAHAHVTYCLCLMILLRHQPLETSPEAPPNQEGVDEAEASEAASVGEPNEDPSKPAFKLATRSSFNGCGSHLLPDGRAPQLPHDPVGRAPEASDPDPPKPPLVGEGSLDSPPYEPCPKLPLG